MTKTQQMVKTMEQAADSLDKRRNYTGRSGGLYAEDIAAMTLAATVLRFVALCMIDDVDEAQP